jgi:cyclic-di-GMP-binding protein
MATEYSFDIVSKIDQAELENALNQTRKEIQTRFDFKGGNPIVEIREKSLFIQAGNKFMLQNLRAVVEGKLAKRGVSLKFFEYGPEEDASKGAYKQVLKFKEGIGKEEAKRLIELIKKNDIKVKTQIQDEQLRVTSKVKDELQKVIKLAKENESAHPFQFVNYR